MTLHVNGLYALYESKRGAHGSIIPPAHQVNYSNCKQQANQY